MKNRIKLEPVIKRNNFNALDTSKVFFYCILGVFIVSLVFNFILKIIANSINVSYEDLSSLKSIKYISTLIIPILYISLFLIYSQMNKINYFKALGSKNKFNFWYLFLTIIFCLISLFMFSPFINLSNYAFQQIGYNNPGELTYAPYNIGSLILTILSVGILTGLAEELLFRGIILRGLLNRCKPLVAIFISTILFVLMHGQLLQTVYQFILGFILSYIAYISGRTIYSIILHILNNSLVIILGYFTNVLDAGSYNTAWNIIYPILLALFGASILIIIFVNEYKLKHKFDVEKSEKEQLKEEAIQQTLINNVTVSDSLNNNLKNLKFFQFFVCLNRVERKYFYSGLLIGLFIWILNTSFFF